MKKYLKIKKHTPLALILVPLVQGSHITCLTLSASHTDSSAKVMSVGLVVCTYSHGHCALTSFFLFCFEVHRLVDCLSLEFS